MYKLIVLSVLTVQCFFSNAQYAGYNPVGDMNRFKEQFAVAAQRITTIKSDFIQEKNLSMLSDKIESRGKLWFKKNNLVRMEYSKPSQYLMIINKDNVYIKDGQKENKVSTGSNKLFRQINRIIVDCVQGTALSNPDFKTRVFESKTGYLVELSPVAKGLKEFFRTINVTIDKKDYSVTGIRMEEVSGDDTVMKFTNKELNATIPDALFRIN
ncbi:MAG: outer membrane lipoprotein carrier protein LolA [Chitinophagaceae bacterium]|nr:outer membrane lipoprotein carrier protein LolA [Chitinophagaceae bacterium]